MCCLFCGNVDIQVKDLCFVEDNVVIWCRWFCLVCGGWFIIYECV